MDFSNLIERDITVHTQNHKFRGVLHDVLTTSRQGVTGYSVLMFEMGVDIFYINADEIIAVTVHGREFD